MTILVVDDDRLQRMVIADILSDGGFSAVAAESVPEGMTILEKQEVDLIITDVYMPYIDGLKFHKMVRDIPKLQLTPFLFISAHDDQLTREAVRNPKIEGFLKKGFSPAMLLEWVKYLTTPLEKRESIRPPHAPGAVTADRKHEDRRSMRR